jgi:dihydropteroate synthase
MGSGRVQLVAILNVTPDSFSDGGCLDSVDAALRAAEGHLEAGAAILDIGGESTRPGALPTPEAEEKARVLPVIRAIRQRFPDVVISIDTRKAAVAEAALDAGASIVNDVSGLQFDAAMAETIARAGAGLILMHSRGTPETMQRDPHYPGGVVEEVTAFFERQLAFAVATGIRRERMILDPGFGFGKTRAHNRTLLARLDAFHALGCPLLVGLSRKSFLSPPEESASVPVPEREALTAAGVALAVDRGAAYVRVHDTVTQGPVVRFAEAVLRQVAVLLLIVLWTLTPLPVQGETPSKPAVPDCASRYEQARTILNTAYQKALNRQQPDMEHFSTGFRQAVEDLKAASCRAELIQLTDYIRTERQKYPVAAPVED